MHRFPVKFVLRQFLLLAFFPAFRHFPIHSFPVQNASDVIISFQMLHANCPAGQIDGIKMPEIFLFPFRLRSRFAVLIQNVFPDQCIFFLQIFPAVIFCFIFMTITNSFIGRLKDREKLGTFVKWCLFKSENILFSLFAISLAFFLSFFRCIKSSLLFCSQIFSRLIGKHNHHLLSVNRFILNIHPHFLNMWTLFHSDAVHIHIIVFLRYLTPIFIVFR